MKLDDYLCKYGRKDFEALVTEALSYSVYLLSLVPTDVEPHQVFEKAQPLIKFLSQRPSDEVLLFLKNDFKNHFKKSNLKIGNDVIDQIFKRIKKIRESECQEEKEVQLTSKDIERALENEAELISVHPAQDFKDDRMFFMGMLKGKIFVVTSEKQILNFDEGIEQGLLFEPMTANIYRFSNQGIRNFINSKSKACPYEIFNKIETHLSRHIYFKDECHAGFLALWIMGTYCFRIFHYYPYVWITAPKRSGKTRLIEVMAPLAFNGIHVLSTTMAVIFRDVHNNLRTLLIDEAEGFTKGDKESSKEFFSLLNGGFERSGSVQRTAKDKNGNYFVESFSSYSPKCFGGIAQIDSVLQDRVIKLPMIRKGKDEIIERYKQTSELSEFLKQTRDELYCFVLDFPNEIFNRYSSLGKIRGVEHLDNRELDIWEPIFVIANLVDDAGKSEFNLTELMKGFSKRSIDLKNSDDVAQDEITKIAGMFGNLLDDKRPKKLKSGENFYFAKMVHQYFKDSKEFDFFLTQNKLTQLLKPMGINSVQRRFEGGVRKRVYIFKLEEISGWINRYKVD